MPELNVTIDGVRQSIPLESSDVSVSIKDLLEGHGISVPSECGGVGKCGFCLVAIISGTCSPLTLAEQSTLSEDEIREGYRLSCQARAMGNVELARDGTAV